jgi:hypothetical protein
MLGRDLPTTAHLMSTSESTSTHLPWHPYARVDLNPMPESALFPSQGLWIWPLSTCSREKVLLCTEGTTYLEVWRLLDEQYRGYKEKCHN